MSTRVSDDVLAAAKMLAKMQPELVMWMRNMVALGPGDQFHFQYGLSRGHSHSATSYIVLDRDHDDYTRSTHLRYMQDIWTDG